MQNDANPSGRTVLPKTPTVVSQARHLCVALLRKGGLHRQKAGGARTPIARWCLEAFDSVVEGREFPTCPEELSELGQTLDAGLGTEQERIAWLGVRLALRCSVDAAARQRRKRTGALAPSDSADGLDAQLLQEITRVVQLLLETVPAQRSELGPDLGVIHPVALGFAAAAWDVLDRLAGFDVTGPAEEAREFLRKTGKVCLELERLRMALALSLTEGDAARAEADLKYAAPVAAATLGLEGWLLLDPGLRAVRAHFVNLGKGGENVRGDRHIE